MPLSIATILLLASIPADCRYDLRFDDHLKLSGKTRTESITFYTDRSRTPLAGSELHLFLKHSPNLDSNRSFMSVNLNYALLRSLRLAYDKETEVVIPIAPKLLKEKNEIRLSVQHFAQEPSSDLWTEIDNRSFIRVRCEDAVPVLDLRQLPYPLLHSHTTRDQRLNVLIPERISTDTLEATALIVANLFSHLEPQDQALSGIRLVHSLRGLNDPVLIVGTAVEQPQMPALAKVETLSAAEGVAALITRSERDTSPIMIVTAKSSTGVLTAARSVFDVASRPAGPREWHGFVPPKAHFSLADLRQDDVRIRPGERSAAVVRLDTTPDARFLNYGLQARLVLDIRQTGGSNRSFLEVFLNETSLGRFPLNDVLTGTRASIRVNAAPGLLKTQNILRVVWDEESPGGELDGDGNLLQSTEFYLPRFYEARLPDLALLKQHLYPFSLRADLSDTVVVVPDQIDDEIFAGVMQLSMNLGRRLPTGNIGFKVMRNSEYSGLMRFGSHAIVLDVDRKKNAKPTVQQTGSSWDPRKYVLKISAGTSDGLHQLIERFFSDGVFNRLEGDTLILSSSQPTMRSVAKPERVVEHLYLTRLEAWLRSNWLALPLILAFVSVVMFVALRLALNQYRIRTNGSV